MAVRPIDANIAMKKIREYMEDFPNASTRLATCRSILSMLGDENQIPTLTPPNEWISVEERLPEPGDLIVYADNTVWGYQYGICRVCGKEKAFDYWIPLQDPPNNRPPEGEEDT